MAGRDEAAKRLERAMLGAADLAAIVLGRELGYFRALRDLGHANGGELAAAAESSARYAREWLEFMAVSHLIDLREQSNNPDARRYSLRPGSEAIFCDEDGSEPIVQDAVFLQSSLTLLPQLVEAYRQGTGLPFSAFGDAARISQELSTKQAYLEDLATRWLPALGPLHQRLLTEPGGRVADIGFGGGWSTIALAKAYPQAEVDGLDLDAASVDLARSNAASEGMSDRLRFHVRDAADPGLAGQYDLVCAFECLHDFTHPVQVLRAMRALLRPGGAVMVGDPAADERFTAPADDGVRMTYGYSLFHCLPVGMDGENAVGTGTVMRPSTVRSYARAAGFGMIEVLEIAHPSWRFYRFAD